MIETPKTGPEHGRLRESLGISQKAFAKVLGVSPSLVCLFERDTRTFSDEFGARYRRALADVAREQVAVAQATAEVLA